ncbi:hypothetical protein J3E71DRAFT_373238 [Bipolaris maydis]|nr:hypothetical protein J3E71DRAFT_373238 [Bipolaris maydis]
MRFVAGAQPCECVFFWWCWIALRVDVSDTINSNLLKNGGIAALACITPASRDASFLRCTFQVKHQCENEREYATFSLQYTTHINGTEDEQAFDLIYDADNPRPTTTKCQKPTCVLLTGDNEAYNLRKPCSIICPSVASCQIASQRFVNLAKSTHIEIVFDWTWLDPPRIQLFTKIVSQPEQLRGFNIDKNNLKGRRLEDWTIFSPKEENVVVSKEPPPYTVHKRPQQVSSSSPSPSPKRVCVIPSGSPTEIATLTERSTTASLPDSPKHLSSASSKLQRTTCLHTVSAHSRSHDEKFYAPKAETDTNVSSALKENIHSTILDILTGVCTSFIDRPHSVSPSLSSSTEVNAHSTTASSLKSNRQLGSFLSKCVPVVTEKFRTILQNMEDEANLRQEADEEFLAVVAEERLDMTQLKEDTLKELGVEIDKVVQEKLDEFSGQLDWLVEQATAKVENAIDTRTERFEYDTQIGNKVTRKGYTAGDLKWRSSRFCSRAR